MLWDLIRDFFVQHIFGGINSNGEGFAGFLGRFASADLDISDGYALDYYVPVGLGTFDGADFTISNSQLYMTFGDYLSTTATIISITIIVVLCCLFVYKIIKLIGGLIR